MIRTAIHAAVWSSSPEPEMLKRTLGAAAGIGFDAVALPLRNPTQIAPARVAAAFHTEGLCAIGTAGLPNDGDIGSADAECRNRGYRHLVSAISLARDCGMIQINGVLYSPLDPPSSPSDAASMKRGADVMHGVAEVAQAAGVVLCLELVNRYETALLNTVDQALEYLALSGHPNLRLHLDTFHLAIEEADPVAAVQAALPEIGYFELGQSHRGRLDQGSLDLAAMSVPLEKAGYNGWIGIEAFARSRLKDDHANALAIWRDHFDDADGLARNAMDTIRKIFNRNAAAAGQRALAN